ncbi:MAG TPA: FtsX-like permease family protein [Steroidobacteraceae bacterium]|nr:FtsX-like permease family protein [Steroidobacteraceae bacterium]
MEILAILSALRRNKIGALLIAVQVALTLAIVSNCLSVVEQRLQRMGRPSGIDEANIFTLGNQWVGQPTDLKARIDEDLAALRALPGVVDASLTNSVPLRGGGWSNVVMLTAEQKQPTAHTAIYFADAQTLNTWGMRLVAGRWFGTDEIHPIEVNDTSVPAVVIVTEALARALFPDGSALGKDIYIAPTAPSRIIGIVARAQTPFAASSWGESFVENSLFAPDEFINNGITYVVRTQPGRLHAVMHAAESKLFAIEPQRVIDRLQPFAETRAHEYRSYRALSLILGTVCALLLTVTAFGIVGLTTYWVTQRRRQIGVRRALGARRVDILRYFQTENLLISGAGAALGVGLGLALNLWLATSLQITRMSLAYLIAGAGIVLVLSQAAVLLPALRAAAIPPAIAIRSA